MRCGSVKELLSEYIDGSLPTQERLGVEDHLAHCHACTDDLELLARTVAMLSRVEEVEVPNGFRAALHQRLKQLPAPVGKPFWKRHASLSLGLPAAAAAMLIGMIAYNAMPQATQLGQDRNPLPAVTSPSGENGAQQLDKATGGSQVLPQGGSKPSVGSDDLTHPTPNVDVPPKNGTGPGPVITPDPTKPGKDPQPVNPPIQPGGGPKDKTPVVALDNALTVDSIVANLDKWVPTVTVGESVQVTPHFRYSAQFTATVADAAGAQKRLQDFAQANGGKITVQDQSSGNVQLLLQIPSGKWTETITLLKGLNGGSAIPGETAFPLTNKYEQAINDKARLVTLLHNAELELSRASDDAIRIAKQSNLTELKKSLKEVDDRLKGFELQNRIGAVQVTLTESNPVSGKADPSQAPN